MADKSTTDRFMNSLFAALEAVPKILEESKLRNELLKKQNDLTEKVIAGRSALLKDLPATELSEAADERAPDTKGNGKAAAKTPEPAAAAAKDDDLELPEEEEEEKVTRRDIVAFVKEATKNDDNLSADAKTAFAAVRREIIGEDENGKPKKLDDLEEADNAAFLKEFKRKWKALNDLRTK